jgi:hypothetical protein
MHLHPDNIISQVTFEVFTDFIWAIVELYDFSDDTELHISLHSFREYVEMKAILAGHTDDVAIADVLRRETMEDLLKEYILHHNLVPISQLAFN